jgi:hypothetical protein
MSKQLGRVIAGFAGVLVALVATLGVEAEMPQPAEPEVRNETDAVVQTPETAIRDWPERPRLAARALIEAYGEPDIFDKNSVSWVGNRPWDETVVRRLAPAGETVAQSIRYPVSLEQLAALRSLGGRLEFDASSGELTSYADAEGLNFLALNLADEIVARKRGPDQARALYRKTRELAEAGKSSPYTSGFLFTQGPRR